MIRLLQQTILTTVHASDSQGPYGANPINLGRVASEDRDLFERGCAKWERCQVLN